MKLRVKQKDLGNVQTRTLKLYIFGGSFKLNWFNLPQITQIFTDGFMYDVICVNLRNLWQYPGRNGEWSTMIWFLAADYTDVHR